MDFELTEEQKALVALVKDFCEREIKPDSFAELASQEVTIENVKENQPWDLVAKLHELGLRQIGVPERYGGTETSWLTMVLIAEAAAKYGSFIWPYLVWNWKFSWNLAAYGSRELQDEFFPKFMEDTRFFWAGAGTEADAGSDTWMPYDGPGHRMKTFAHKDGDEWVINGQKNFTTFTSIADAVFIVARTDRDKPFTESVARFLVPTDTPGFSISRFNDVMGEGGGLNADLLLEDCRVPERYLVEEPGKAAAKRLSQMLAGKMTDDGAELGMAWAMYELTKEYTKTRIQGGKPIFEHKNVGPLVVELGMRIEAMRLLAYRCAWEFDKTCEEAGDKPPEIDPLWYELDHAWKKMNRMRVIEILTEVFGAMGVMSEYPVADYLKGQLTMQHTGSTMTMNLIKCMSRIDEFVPVGALR